MALTVLAVKNGIWPAINHILTMHRFTLVSSCGAIIVFFDIHGWFEKPVTDKIVCCLKLGMVLIQDVLCFVVRCQFCDVHSHRPVQAVVVVARMRSL